MVINTYKKLYPDNSDVILLLLSVLLRDLNEYATVICFSLIVYKISNQKIYFPYSLLWIFLCFISFYINSQATGLVTIHNTLWFSIPSLLALFIGYNYAFKYGKNFSMLVLLFVMSLSLSLPNIIITVYDILKVGLINAARELTTVTGEAGERAVTGRTIELTMTIAGISMIYFYKRLNKNKYIKYYVALALVAELCTLHYLSRTGIAIFLISLIIGFLYTFKMRNIFRFALILIILALLFQNFVEDSVLFQLFADREIEGSNVYNAGGRSDRWLDGLLLLLSSPSGYDSRGWYVHNFWLDFGRVGGLIPFVCLSLFSIYVLIKTIILQKVKSIPSYIRYNILIFVVITNIAFFTEPVHSGSSISMYFYFMLSGIVLGLYRQKRYYEDSIHRSIPISDI